jgi:hypothetical protein
MYFVSIFRDKRMFDKSGNPVFRKRSIFGKLKPHSHEREQTASLPPNFRLTRQNSTHVYVSNEKKKFPWTRNETAKSDDDDGRLSTISSKDGSRQSSEKRKNGNGIYRQDSECQTDQDMYHVYVTKECVRHRKSSKSSNQTKHTRHDSDSSINSDDFFLSHPPSSAQERRKMCNKNSQSEDTSPLLGNETVDDMCKIRSVNDDYSYNYITPNNKNKTADGGALLLYASPEVSSNEKAELYLHHVNKIKDANQGISNTSTYPTAVELLPVVNQIEKPESQESVSFLLQPTSSALYARRVKDIDSKQTDDRQSTLNNVMLDTYQRPITPYSNAISPAAQSGNRMESTSWQGTQISNRLSQGSQPLNKNNETVQNPYSVRETVQVTPNEQKYQTFGTQTQSEEAYHNTRSSACNSKEFASALGFTAQTLSSSGSKSTNPKVLNTDVQFSKHKMTDGHSANEFEDNCDLHRLSFSGGGKSPSDTKSDTDNASIQSFKTYMKKRGIEIDMSSIKSSQV